MNKIPKMETHKRLVAYHEAGHVIAHIESHIAFKYVRIRSINGVYTGLIELYPSKSSKSLEYFLIPSYFFKNFPLDFIGYAGYLAESIYKPEINNNHGGYDDLQRIKSCYKDFPTDLKEKYFQFLESYTRNALVKDWYAVSAIAEALIEKETLTLDRALSIAKNAAAMQAGLS